MKKRLLLLSILLLCFAVFNPLNVLGDEDDLTPPSKDSFVRQQSPGSNFGGANTLQIQSLTGEIERTYIEFDLSSIAGAHVTSAKLCLWQTNNLGGDGRTYRVQRITGDWTENGLTWNSQPSVDSGYVEQAGSASNDFWWNVSVTSLFVMDNTIGFRVIDNDEGTAYGAYTVWSSKEGSYDPFLEVVYTANIPPTNDYLALENPSEGSQGCFRITEHVFRVKVSDLNGSDEVDYVDVSFDPSGVDLKYRWNQTSDVFSEVSDLEDYCSISSVAGDSNAVGDQWTLDFKLTFNNSYPDEELHDVEVYVVDDWGWSDNDTYSDVYYVKHLPFKYEFVGPFFEGGGSAGYVELVVHFEVVSEKKFWLFDSLNVSFEVEPQFFLWNCSSDDRYYYADDLNITVYVPDNPQLYLFTIRDYSGITGMGDQGFVEFYRPGCGSEAVERHGVADVINDFTACLDVGASYEIVYVNYETEYRFGIFVAGGDLTEELLIYAQMFNPQLKGAYMYVHADGWRSSNNTLIIVDYEDVNEDTDLVELYILEKNGTVMYYDNSTGDVVQFQWNQAGNETDYVAYVSAVHGEFGGLTFKIPLPYVVDMPNPFGGLEYLGFIGPKEQFPTGNLIGIFIVVAAGICFSFLSGPAGMFVMVITALSLSAVGMARWTGSFEGDLLLLSILGSLAILWALARARSSNK